MKKIYVIGHGIMANEDKKLTTLLKHDFITYCKAGKMFDGGCASKVVDGGGYVPVRQSSINDAGAGESKAGETITSHYACSERTAMFVDLKLSEKMTIAKPNIHKTMVQLGGGAGKLYTLDGDTYVYITEEAVLTPLAVIQGAIDAKFPDWEYQIHWSLCRSYAEGGTDEAIFEFAKVEMLGGPTKLCTG